MPLLLASVGFVALFLLLVTVLGFTPDSGESAEQRRLLRYVRQIDLQEPPDHDRGLRSVISVVGKLFSFLMKGRVAESWLASELESADIPLKSSEFATLNAGLACVSGLAARIAGGSAFAVVLALVFGTLSPLAYVRVRKMRRIARFGSQLPDALTLISGSLRAGHSFLQALEVAARETSKPASREFARVIRELSLGAPFEDALSNLGKRINSKDLELVITAVLIQRQVGGNLSELLDTVAETIRERVRIQGEIKTLTAQGRVSGVVISLLPIGLAGAMSVINPGYLGVLFSHPFGRLALWVSGGGMLIGIWLVNRIARIEV